MPFFTSMSWCKVCHSDQMQHYVSQKTGCAALAVSADATTQTICNQSSASCPDKFLKHAFTATTHRIPGEKPASCPVFVCYITTD